MLNIFKAWNKHASLMWFVLFEWIGTSHFKSIDRFALFCFWTSEAETWWSFRDKETVDLKKTGVFQLNLNPTGSKSNLDFKNMGVAALHNGERSRFAPSGPALILGVPEDLFLTEIKSLDDAEIRRQHCTAQY